MERIRGIAISRTGPEKIGLTDSQSDIDDDAMDLDDPRPNSPNRAPNAASMGTDLAFSRGEQDNDEDEYHTDGHSSIPSSSGHSSPEPPIVTRTWASHIDATIHPRNLKTREVLDFKDWPQGVMYGLRDLADCVADGEVAAEFVKRAFEKRREGSRDFVKPSWVAASDVDWAVMLAKRDGYTRKEITVPVKGRFDRFK